MVALEYKIDLSRLEVIELDNNNKIKDKITIEPGEKFEFPLLMHEINVLPIELPWLTCYINRYPKINFYREDTLN